ncbi:DHH family phosphoesterase [Succinispira mobilis]|uniref:DHH family phosphoesterase n=1 Tax=Succinispira mobilis TaxID=78120 RepID=UPI0003720451|nr:bifunctional oligoribonuclease/PAP phosphatase NrnA [Succinispira mobilis]
MVECSISEAAAIIRQSHKLAIVAHVNPDPDTLGSVLGLGRALEKTGKEIIMLVDDKIAHSLNFMPGIGEIKRPEEIREQAFDLLVILDASDLDRIGNVAKGITAPILNIDHHISNSLFADYLVLDTKAAATGEIIYLLLQELEIPLDIEIATNLYTAIATDCGFFQYANTTSRTMCCAAKLLEYGIKPNEISDNLEVKTLESIQLLSKVLQTMEFYSQNRIAVISLPKLLCQEGVETEGFIRYPRYIDGVEVAVLFKYVSDKTTRISMRSKNLDVSEVALLFGGGGHKRAAGCTIYEDINTAKNQLIKKLNEAIEAEENNA